MRRPLLMLVVGLALAAALVAPVAGESPTLDRPRLDVPYVPTPERVVDEMLKVAKVTSNDVIYDLGSGDGRIVITAAKRFGARGVGIDIDPERVKEANENAKAAGVTDKVKFIQGDIFAADFSEATVVTMYLLPSVNMKLKPKLLQLRPGTRIVSHDFDLGEWKPQRRIVLQVNGNEHVVFFWIVPKGAPARQ